MAGSFLRPKRSVRADGGGIAELVDELRTDLVIELIRAAIVGHGLLPIAFLIPSKRRFAYASAFRGWMRIDSSRSAMALS